MFSSTKVLFKSVKMNIFHVNNRWGTLCLSQGRRMSYPAWYTYIVLKASSCVTFSVIFATRASIVCIQQIRSPTQNFTAEIATNPTLIVSGMTDNFSVVLRRSHIVTDKRDYGYRYDRRCLLLPRLGGAFDLRLAVSVPLPIVMGIFVLLWFQSRLT